MDPRPREIEVETGEAGRDGCVCEAGVGLDARREHESRLVELGRLAAMANHELRQPLLGIKAFSEMIAEGAQVPDHARDWARKIFAQAQRMERMVEGMRDLSRPARPQMQRINCDGLVADVLGFASFLFREPGVRLSSTLTSQAHVTACPDQLQQLLLNLIANGRDAILKRGGGRVQVATLADGTHLDVLVGDDGPGLDPATLDDLAVGFRTTKPEGTGLGLVVSRAIARRHGGTLELVTDAPPILLPPVRTLFRLRLPQAH